MRGKSRFKHAGATQPLFYSAIPQIVFRDMLPDEDVVRALQDWHADHASERVLVTSVTVAPLAERGEQKAELKVLGWAMPIEGVADTPSAAVQRALEQLPLQRNTPCSRAPGAELTLVA